MELRFHCKYVYNRIMIPLNTHLQKKKKGTSEELGKERKKEKVGKKRGIREKREWGARKKGEREGGEIQMGDKIDFYPLGRGENQLD